MSALPRKAHTVRRKVCRVCRERCSFTLDERGEPVLAAHEGLNQAHLPKSERTQCLGVGQRAAR